MEAMDLCELQTLGLVQVKQIDPSPDSYHLMFCPHLQPFDGINSHSIVVMNIYSIHHTQA